MKSIFAALLIAFALFVITSPLWLGYINQPRVDAHRFVVPTEQAGADAERIADTIDRINRNTKYVKIRQLQQGPADGGVQFGQGAQINEESPVVTMPAPGVGQITASGPGAANVEAWMRRNCEPGSKYAKQYPCVTSDANGNACQIGTCRPAEIEGLPALSRGGAR